MSDVNAKTDESSPAAAAAASADLQREREANNTLRRDVQRKVKALTDQNNKLEKALEEAVVARARMEDEAVLARAMEAKAKAAAAGAKQATPPSTHQLSSHPSSPGHGHSHSHGHSHNHGSSSHGKQVHFHNDHSFPHKSFNVGARVEANYKGEGWWFYGIVTRARINGTFDVDYDDGEKETCISADLIRAVEFAVDEKVEVNYKDTGKWYPATISRARLDDTFDIDYDDGETEAGVRIDLIRVGGGQGRTEEEFGKREVANNTASSSSSSGGGGANAAAISELRAEIARLSSALAETRADLSASIATATASHPHTTPATAVAASDDEYTRLKAKSDGLERTLIAMREESENHKGLISALNNHLKELHGQVGDLEQQLHESKQSHRDEKNRREGLEVQGEKSHSHTQVNELEGKLEEALSSLHALRGKYSADVSANRMEISSLRSRLKKLTEDASVSSREAELALSRREMQGSMELLESMTQRLTTAEDDCTRWSNTLHYLEDSIARRVAERMDNEREWLLQIEKMKMAFNHSRAESIALKEQIKFVCQSSLAGYPIAMQSFTSPIKGAGGGQGASFGGSIGSVGAASSSSSSSSGVRVSTSTYPRFEDDAFFSEPYGLLGSPLNAVYNTYNSSSNSNSSSYSGRPSSAPGGQTGRGVGGLPWRPPSNGKKAYVRGGRSPRKMAVRQASGQASGQGEGEG